jgi:hypothetical protein
MMIVKIVNSRNEEAEHLLLGRNIATFIVTEVYMNYY